jgi:hypothetical protein
MLRGRVLRTKAADPERAATNQSDNDNSQYQPSADIAAFAMSARGAACHFRMSHVHISLPRLRRFEYDVLPDCFRQSDYFFVMTHWPCDKRALCVWLKRLRQDAHDA